MSRKLCLLATMFVACFANSVTAQETPPAKRVAAIEQFLDENTVAVVRLDLSRLDLKGGYERVVKQWEIPAEQALQGKDALKVAEMVKQQLLAAGAREIFAILSSGGEDEEPFGFVVLPVAKGKDPAAVVEVIKSLPGVDVEPLVMEQAVVLCGPENRETIEELEADDRSEIAAAFASIGAADLQFAFFPNDDIIEKIQAATPGDEADDEVSKYSEEIEWIALTANLPPKPAFGLITNFSEEETAVDALAELNKLLAHPAIQEFKQDPVTAKAIAALMPKRQGSQLRILVSESNGGIQAVTEGIRANLDKAMEFANQSGGK